MTDAIANAQQQLNEPQTDASPSSTEPSPITEIVDEFKHLGEKVEHLIHPDVQAVAQAGETGAAQTTGSGSSGSAQSTSPSTSGEHPHTSILRRMTQTLRRKFNVFDSELEAVLKDAEAHL